MKSNIAMRSLALLLWLSAFVFCTQVSAQAIEVNDQAFDESTDRLEVLQSLIDNNLEARSELRAVIKGADPSELSELQRTLETLNADLDKFQASFEQIAVGAVDVTLLGDVDTSFDWRVEVSEILRPIVENLKALTDKPRKISKLQSVLEQNLIQQDAIAAALESIKAKMETSENPAIQTSLVNLVKVWERRRADTVQERDIALLQLADLQRSDVSWQDTIRVALNDFVKGRGLTLLLAVLVAVIIWFITRGVLKLFQLKAKNENQDDFRTRKRLAQYAFHALTLLLILIGIISVFYIRGDMLLLGLSMLAAAAIALGLRQAIPQFIDEAKILLNLGSVRENERVFHNGLPWQVVSLNMQSVLRNPELKGVLRLPLSDIRSMVSRPAGNEPWYPASRGDFIVLDDDRLMQVVRLTPETIELSDRGGAITAVPASEFYQLIFRNLCRGDSFGISSTFGIDYRHQAISLVDVPERLNVAIEAALQTTNHRDAVQKIQIELESAGSSSLDYWIHVTLDKTAAKGYSKLNRLIQQTCVKVCTEQDWGIPFPHITIQKLDTTHA